ncbi:MAG: hypothetical protein QM817_41175 [Archangium sp.]
MKRVSVSLRVSQGQESVETEARAGHRIMFGDVEAIVGFGDRGAIIITLRRVPEGVSVLAGAEGIGAPMKEVYERAAIELPAHVTTVVEDQWTAFVVEVARETFERLDPTLVHFANE